ncbi:MAG: 2-C-methyl-D-erythritol 2,4-cyclodiphosphate synthase [Spirochaetales bacterium]|nr:2-C-methyl-D-erythritol 2,4-cyclodiphosphate synthase [Spirochaetales bacterium]
MSGRELRIGEGWDVHRLVEGRRLLLGGVDIPFERGELGHSDGDALLHAITDALLGAAALGDIGSHFPPSDARWKDADSLALLAEAAALVSACGWRIVNLDCTVCIERPRLRPHVDAIRERVSDALGIEADRVSVKAKTYEGLGPVGSGEAVEARAVVLIDRTR